MREKVARAKCVNVMVQKGNMCEENHVDTGNSHYEQCFIFWVKHSEKFRL